MCCALVVFVFVARRVLRIDGACLFVVCCSGCVVRCALRCVRCLLSVVGCLWFVACCLLCVVC